MSSLFYQVRAKRHEKDNVQKLECLGIYFLFHGRYSKKRPLSGNDFRGSVCYRNRTQNDTKFYQHLGCQYRQQS